MPSGRELGEEDPSNFKVPKNGPLEIDGLLEQAFRRLDELAKDSSSPRFTQVLREIKEATGIDIKLWTLRRRYYGLTKPSQYAHANQQLLTPEQERVLCQWIIFYSDTGNPLDKLGLRKKVKALCGKMPSPGWVKSFLRRWPHIRLGRPSSLDPKRAQAFNRPTVSHHCRLLQAIIDKYQIPVENIYNMDEKGCQLGGGRKREWKVYLIPRCHRPKYKRRSDNLELITIIECVCADGTPLFPGFVFQKGGFCADWFDVHDDICVATSENGWTDDFLCAEWFQLSFIPQATKRNKSGKPILLVLDGHGSHETLKMIDVAIANGIIIFCLPPHTTHKLQPLDVGVFGPFSRAWIERCSTILETDPNGLAKENFIKEYMDVRSKSFSATTIKQAFRKSSVYPVNYALFTDADFAPSFATSTTYGHTPSDFPVSTTSSPSNLDDDSGDKGEEEDSDLEREDSDEEVDDEGDDEDESEDEGEGEQAGDLGNRSGSAQSAQVLLIDDPFNLLGSIDPLTESIEANRHQDDSDAVSPSSSSFSSASSCSSGSSSRLHSPSASSIISAPSSSRTSTRASLKRPTNAERIKALEEELRELRDEVQASKAHCQLAYDEIATLKRKHAGSQSNTRPKRPKLNTDARILTSAAGRAKAQQQAAAKAEKDRKKQEAIRKRQADEIQRAQRRKDRGDDFEFKGLLSSRNKTDLSDIAYDLGLPDSGTKTELHSRINAYFDENPEKKLQNRYKGLFSTRRQRIDTCSSATLPPPETHPPAQSGSSSTSQSVHYPAPAPSFDPYPVPQLQTSVFATLPTPPNDLNQQGTLVSSHSSVHLPSNHSFLQPPQPFYNAHRSPSTFPYINPSPFNGTNSHYYTLYRHPT